MCMLADPPSFAESVWLHLNERYLSHRLHADYDTIV